MMPSPLRGVTVLVSRPHQSSTVLADVLRTAGATVVCEPAVQIHCEEPVPELDRALSSIEEFEWMVFTSRHAVTASLRRADVLGIDPVRMRSRRIAAVGPATSQPLEDAGLLVELTGYPYSAEGLLIQMRSRLYAGATILYPRARDVSPVLGAGLRGFGASVCEVVAYETRALTAAPGLSAALGSGVDCVVFCSPSAIRATRPHHHLIERSLIACIGPITAEAARAAGLTVSIVPDRATARALAESVVAHFSVATA